MKRKGIVSILLLYLLCALLFVCSGSALAADKPSLAKASVSLRRTSYTYDGKAKKPSVTVHYKGKKLKSGRDYTLTYSGGRKYVGIYSVTVKGKGQYTGSVKKTFRIHPPKTRLTSLAAPKGGSTLKLSWKKTAKQTAGYQVRWSAKKSMSKAKMKTIKGRAKGSVTLTGLKAGSRYYLQIRTYQVAKGKKYYSAWSAVVSKTTAKKSGTGQPGSQVSHPKFAFSDSSYASQSAEAGERFDMAVNNQIKSVSISGDGTTACLTDKTAYACSFIALSPGKTTITLTDIYGQTLTGSVSVTQTYYDNNYAKTVLKSSRSDPSLPKPSIESVYYGSSYVTLNCPGTFLDTDAYDGYESYLSPDKSFTKGFETTYTTSQWNKGGYGKMTYFYTWSGVSYYAKVRSFKVEGTTKVYGPWSSVKKISVGNFSSKSDGKPQYSYQVYFLDKNGTGLYSGSMRAVYIKTDNPDPSSIRLTANGASVLRDIQIWGGGQYYDDILYKKLSDRDELLKAVDGGYVGYLDFDDPGTYSVEVRECSLKGYTVAKTLTWTVQDYDTAMYAWIDRILAAHTNASMTPFEKMEAVCSYLTTPGLFRYVTQSNDENVILAAQPNGPCFVTYRWDSYTSPAMLCHFAERIGGFDDIHNCYGDYPIGSVQWSYNHYKARLTVNGESRTFEVCPPSYTGDIGEVSYIDFSDTSSLQSAE